MLMWDQRSHARRVKDAAHDAGLIPVVRLEHVIDLVDDGRQVGYVTFGPRSGQFKDAVCLSVSGRRFRFPPLDDPNRSVWYPREKLAEFCRFLEQGRRDTFTWAPVMVAGWPAARQ